MEAVDALAGTRPLKSSLLSLRSSDQTIAS